jgi:hypothetical protein
MEMSGVFLTKGMTVGITPEALRVIMEGGDLVPQVRYDMCIAWVEIALGHLSRARDFRADRDAAWKEAGNDLAKAAALEGEFESALQAIAAMAFALDALYAMLSPHAGISADIRQKWKERGTARYAQIAEVFKVLFKLSNSTTQELRRVLKAIFEQRDYAVHPPGVMAEAIMHPELRTGVDPRFVRFRATTAEAIVMGATWLLWQLAAKGTSRDADAARYVAGLKERLKELFPNGHPLQSRQSGGTEAAA